VIFVRGVCGRSLGSMELMFAIYDTLSTVLLLKKEESVTALDSMYGIEGVGNILAAFSFPASLAKYHTCFGSWKLKILPLVTAALIISFTFTTRATQRSRLSTVHNFIPFLYLV